MSRDKITHNNPIGHTAKFRESRCKKVYYDEFGYPVQNDREDEVQLNEYMTPHEVMAFLAIGRNTFYRMVNSGELPAFRIGKLWRVRREDLRSWIPS